MNASWAALCQSESGSSTLSAGSFYDSYDSYDSQLVVGISLGYRWDIMPLSVIVLGITERSDNVVDK